MIVQLRGVGVPAMDVGARWKRALVREDGQVYDAIIDSNGYKLQSTKPLVRRDEENPKVLHITVGDDSAGRKHLARFLDDAKFRVQSNERSPVSLPESTFNWGFGPELKLTALKMAFAMSTIAFPSEVAGFVEPRKELKNPDLSRPPRCVQSDLREHSALDKLREELCHVIYVEERKGTIHAIVQFFGGLQFWVQLGSEVRRNYEKAMLAVLDPVSGVERFDATDPLRIEPWRADDVIDAMMPVKKINAGAVARGAQTPEMLKARSITLNGVEHRLPKRYRATGWTGNIPKKT